MKYNGLILFRSDAFHAATEYFGDPLQTVDLFSCSFSTIRRLEIQKIIVVDSFYAGPFRVRDVALRADYMDVRSMNYPGFQSCRSFFSKSLKNEFAELIGESLAIEPNKLTFGKFRAMFGSTGTRLKVHVDGAADWTGLIYLNLLEQCRGGTAFYRHKKTGLEGPPAQYQAEALGLTDPQEFESIIVEADTLNSEAWEQTTFVGMRFNRLLLFRGNELFHCHTSAWGTAMEDARLTQNFFFNSCNVI